MKAFLFSLIAFLSLSVGLKAQSGTVTGIVEDGAGKKVENVTVGLHRVSDSVAIKYTVTNKEGQFLVEGVRWNQYFITVTAVGYGSVNSRPFTLSEAMPSYKAQIPTLQPTSKSMGAVTVAARKPLIEQKIDRTVVNVEASPTNAGSSALEVLEKSPGITVDKDGNISLKGKAGVTVFVDGRPTQLGAADLANLLRNMNASQLEQIEIMTNPPARYDAAGNAGIINIKTKKNKAMGYNGSVNLNYGQGRYPKLNEGLNLNYRQGKWNLFTNLSHGYRERFGQLNIQRKFTDKNTKELISSFDQGARMRNKNSSYNAKLGADYFASKNTTVGVVLSGFSSPSEFGVRNQTNIFDNTGALLTQARAVNRQTGTFENLGANFNIRQILDTAGKELTADFDYLQYDGNNNQRLSNYYFNAAGEQSQKGDTLFGHFMQDIRIYSGRVDYTMPLTKNAKFEAGLKSSIVRTDNNAIYDTVHNGALLRDYNRSNHFVYDENINAAYVNVSGPLSKKWSGQLGLRLENTAADGDQRTTGERFKRRYTQLFPTAFLQYAVNEKNNLVLNYGRRLRRPNYESLNPFVNFIDRYTYQQGNPNLKPQFSHNVELTHSYKGWLNTTLNYTNTTDIIQQVIEQNEATNETYAKQANIANQRQVGLAVSLNKPFTKWWTASLYLNGYHNRFEGPINGVPVTVDAATLNLNGSQQFKLSKTLSAELSGWYRTAGVEGIMQTKPMGGLNAGLSKIVLKEKGTLRLTVRDIFYSQQFRATSRYGNVDVAFQEANDSRVAAIGFTYRFSKGKTGGAKRREGSASDEQNRVGGGN